MALSQAGRFTFENELAEQRAAALAAAPDPGPEPEAEAPAAKPSATARLTAAAKKYADG